MPDKGWDGEIIFYCGKNIEELSREELLAAFRVAAQEIQVLRQTMDGYIEISNLCRQRHVSMRKISA